MFLKTISKTVTRCVFKGAFKNSEKVKINTVKGKSEFPQRLIYTVVEFMVTGKIAASVPFLSEIRPI